MAIEARNVPRLTEVAARIHLARLEAVEDGDVFYLAADPESVWACHPVSSADSYMFTQIGSDFWVKQVHVGDGTPNQTVVVLHNTRKYLRPDD